MPTVMLNVSGMRISAEQRRQALLDVAEVDVLDQADHQEADEDQHRRRRHERHEDVRAASARSRQQEQHAVTTDVNPVRPPSATPAALSM